MTLLSVLHSTDFNCKALFAFILFAAFLASSPADASYRGLEEVQDLNSWTLELYQGEAQNGVYAQAETLVQAWSEAQELNTWYQTALRPLAKSYGLESSYQELADILFEVRSQIRQLSGDETYRKKSLLLIETLLEETLFIAHTRFGVATANGFLRTKSGLTTHGCKNNNQERRVSNDLFRYPICQGDVIAMKGSSGTSSLLSRISTNPGNYSHSTIAYVEPESSKLYFIESLIEDGVRLRAPWLDIVSRTHKKFAVYRYTGSGRDRLRSRVVEETDAFVERMRQSQAATLWRGDVSRVNLTEYSSFPYNFDFDVDVTDAYFCSQVPYAIYNSAVGGDRNDVQQAYPASLWSEISEGNFSFFSRFLGIQSSTYPAPSDIEFNPYFELALFFIYPPALHKDRIDNAMVDALAMMIRQGDPEWNAILESFQVHGQRVFRKSEIRPLIKRLSNIEGLPNELRVKLQGLWDKLPESATLNQIIFFALYNEIVTPQMHELVGQKETELGRPLGLIELRLFAAEALLGMSTQTKQVIQQITEAL